MSLRKDWRFEYFCSLLVEPARKKEAEHKERMESWAEVNAQAVQEAKTTAGVEVYQVTGGARADLKIDASLANRINESLNKRNEHERLMKEYAMFARAFELNGAVTVYLDAEDILFFGL